MACARLPGVIIGEKKVILGKSARLNTFLSYFFNGFWSIDLLTTLVSHLYSRNATKPPKFQTVEPLLIAHPIQSGQLSKTQNYCRQNSVNKSVPPFNRSLLLSGQGHLLVLKSTFQLRSPLVSGHLATATSFPKYQNILNKSNRYTWKYL